MSTHECKHLNLSTAVSICMKLDVHYASDDSQSRNSSIHWRQQTISIQTWNGIQATQHILFCNTNNIYIHYTYHSIHTYAHTPKTYNFSHFSGLWKTVYSNCIYASHHNHGHIYVYISFQQHGKGYKYKYLIL